MFRSRSAASRPSQAASPATPTIAVADLRVGMFIHLDGGWLTHPFARSSFRIASTQQIDTLRGLKLERVRFSPELSEPEAELEAESEARSEPQAAVPAAGGAAAPTSNAGAAQASERRPATPGAAAPAAPVARASSATAGAQQRRAALAEQRAVQQQCERQFAEASAAWRQAAEALAGDPEQARAAAQGLAKSLTDKLMTDGEVGIRLLPSTGNDRAAAHALNVTVVAMLLARSLGLARDELNDLSVGALLHDVGKLELPERARHLDAGASAADAATYREHVVRGVALARRMALPEGALTVIAQHHEHADASGFPLRLGGDRMNLAARIVAIVNRYDNLCNPPTRTPPLTPHEAVATLFAHGRTHYDAAVLNAFIRMMGVYPAGSLVQLTDERYAMVVSANSSRPLKPRVLVHEAGVPRSEALLLDLDAHPDLGIRRSLVAAKMPEAALQYLDPRPRVAYFFEPLAAAGAQAPAREGVAA
jgi:putative nucleotidyltransferase with HDIG domain